MHTNATRWGCQGPAAGWCWRGEAEVHLWTWRVIDGSVLFMTVGMLLVSIYLMCSALLWFVVPADVQGSCGGSTTAATTKALVPYLHRSGRLQRATHCSNSRCRHGGSATGNGAAGFAACGGVKAVAVAGCTTPAGSGAPAALAAGGGSSRLYELITCGRPLSPPVRVLLCLGCWDIEM